jgi:hypothetical protein
MAGIRKAYNAHITGRQSICLEQVTDPNEIARALSYFCQLMDVGLKNANIETDGFWISAEGVPLHIEADHARRIVSVSNDAVKIWNYNTLQAEEYYILPGAPMRVFLSVTTIDHDFWKMWRAK